MYSCVQPVTNVNNSQCTLAKTYGITIRKFSAFFRAGCFEDGYWCRPNTVRCEVSRQPSFLRLGSWGLASANTSLYIWLDVSLDYLATHTLWLATYLRCHGGRQDDFLSRALERQYILGRLRFFRKQCLPLFLWSVSASLAKVEHQIKPSSLN